MDTTCFRLTREELETRIPTPDEKRFVVGMERGQLLVELYCLEGADHQKPHTRDEAYVVVEGEGTFLMGEERVPFKPGDFLFVSAGVVHRFEDFGERMAAWVIFYGPEGGELTGIRRSAEEAGTRALI